MSKGFSCLDLYYKDAGKFSLLTREEEQCLGKRVQSGEKALAEPAIKKLIESNLRLVAKIAQDFQGRGLDIEDLISEGNVGLCVAAKKYDPSKGAKFSYYASFWIKQGIFRAVANQGRLIRIPVNSLDKYFKIITYINNHQKEHGEKPSQKQISKKFKITIKRVAQIIKAAEPVIPLDAQISKDGGGKIHDVIPDKDLTPYETLSRDEDYKMIGILVNKLPKRESLIIKNRFGLGGVNKKTLEALGLDLKITRERVRQLETIALNKLKFLAREKIGK